MEDQATLRFIKMIPIGNLQKLSLLSGFFSFRGSEPGSKLALNSIFTQYNS